MGHEKSDGTGHLHKKTPPYHRETPLSSSDGGHRTSATSASKGPREKGIGGMLNRRILSVTSFGLFLFAAALPAFAQTEPDVQYPVHSDISPALRDIVSTTQPPAGRTALAPMPIPRMPVSSQIDPVVQNRLGGPSSATKGIDFDGVGAPNTCNC